MENFFRISSRTQNILLFTLICVGIKPCQDGDGQFFFLHLKRHTLESNRKIYERFGRQVESVCYLLKSFITFKVGQALQIFEQHARKRLLKVTASWP